MQIGKNAGSSYPIIYLISASMAALNVGTILGESGLTERARDTYLSGDHSTFGLDKFGGRI